MRWFPIVVVLCFLIIAIQISVEIFMVDKHEKQKKEKQCAVVCGTAESIAHEQFPLCGCITWKELK